MSAHSGDTVMTGTSEAARLQDPVTAVPARQPPSPANPPRQPPAPVFAPITSIQPLPSRITQIPPRQPLPARMPDLEVINGQDWLDFLDSIRSKIADEPTGREYFNMIRGFAHRLDALGDYDPDYLNGPPDDYQNLSLVGLARVMKEMAEGSEQDLFDDRWTNLKNMADDGLMDGVADLYFKALGRFKRAQRNGMPPLRHYQINATRELDRLRMFSTPAIKEFGPTTAMAGIEGMWHYEHSVGAGGFGNAGLWYRTDGSNKIVDRMVIKDVRVRQKDWDNPQIWTDSTDGKRDSYEAYIQGILTNASAGRSIVPLIASVVVPDRLMYRLYMPFSPHGHLFDVLRDHFVKTADWDRSGNPVPIAEKFCWFVLLQLAEAGCYMKNGVLPGKDSTTSWGPDKCIVHLDLKPNNGAYQRSSKSFVHPLTPGEVFLGEVRDGSINNEWIGFPDVKLADWGLASEVRRPNVRNPEDLVGRGTPGWRAPEHVRDATGSVPIGSPANVFAIGRTMLTFLNIVVASGYKDTDKVEDCPFVPQNYSGDLVHLVQQCLHDAPEDRIAIEDLFCQVDTYVRNGIGGTTPLILQPKKVSEVVRWPAAKLRYVDDLVVS